MLASKALPYWFLLLSLNPILVFSLRALRVLRGKCFLIFYFTNGEANRKPHTKSTGSMFSVGGVALA